MKTFYVFLARGVQIVHFFFLAIDFTLRHLIFLEFHGRDNRSVSL